jgi:hypothetical protein
MVRQTIHNRRLVFVHLSCQFFMGGRVGVKRHGDNEVINGSSHFDLRGEFICFLLSAETSSTGNNRLLLMTLALTNSSLPQDLGRLQRNGDTIVTGNDPWSIVGRRTKCRHRGMENVTVRHALHLLAAFHFLPDRRSAVDAIGIKFDPHRVRVEIASRLLVCRPCLCWPRAKARRWLRGDNAVQCSRIRRGWRRSAESVAPCFPASGQPRPWERLGRCDYKILELLPVRAVHRVPRLQPRPGMDRCRVPGRRRAPNPLPVHRLPPTSRLIPKD